MRSTAQFTRTQAWFISCQRFKVHKILISMVTANTSNAYNIAILLTKERHRTKLPRRIIVHSRSLNLLIATNPAIDCPFDSTQLFRRHLTWMREIETQPIGSDQGTGLFDMFSKKVSQDPMKQMGRCMIAHDIPPTSLIHNEPHLISNVYNACFNTTLVHKKVRNRLLHVLNTHPSVWTNEHTSICYLSTRFSIE